MQVITVASDVSSESSATSLDSITADIFMETLERSRRSTTTTDNDTQAKMEDEIIKTAGITNLKKGGLTGKETIVESQPIDRDIS